ncbi:uncharacterized protein LOC116141811 [Pistacia vera]|uniref:uncharacterized protein LOC116141811 n=1 Tax=Pistacia vera TaxID=55513 RepID=UPI0012637ED2|nr:uncharacterized protein LOC116141811 [Pistacia vera]
MSSSRCRQNSMLDEDCEEISPFPMPMNEDATGSKKQCTMTNNAKRNRPIGIGDYFAPRTTLGSQPSIKSVLHGKEVTWRADMPFVDAIIAVGPGYKALTYHAMRGNLLRDAKKEVQLFVDSYRNTWKDVGCTLIADGWTDNSHRSLINFLVYCPKGVCFVKSVNVSDVVNDAETLFNLFEEIFLWIGPINIVHVVTDNGSNYKAAGRMLCEKYNNITWSPCAAHCINLMLKDIAEMDHVVCLTKRASKVTKFVYNHTFLIAWLRKRQGWKEIVRPGVTCFATTFIVLRNLNEHKHDLQAMVTNRFFVDSRYAKSNKGKDVISIILNNEFWDDMGMVSKVVGPLMRLLQIVGSYERPAIGYVYDDMYKMRLGIKKLFKNKMKLYKPYTRMIKLHWDRMLRCDIHAAAYYLNPTFQYNRASFSTKPEVMRGLLDIIESKASVLNVSKSTLVKESRIFQDREKCFSRELAIETCKTTRPDERWRTFGYSTPNLQKLAIKIVSQTSTCSGYERNWSVFERIHSKKRNRLEYQRLNDLVFFHYNLRLQDRRCCKKMSFDPIDYESIDKTEAWIVDDEEKVGELNYDELEQTLYGEGSIPVNVGDHSSYYDSTDVSQDCFQNFK